MAGQSYYFQGPCKWAKVYKPDMQFEPGSFSIDMYLDEDALAEFKRLGLRNKVKEDEDGKYVSFKRKVGRKPWPKEVPEAEREMWGPPEVVDAKGNPFKELIGNLSIVAIELDVFDSVKYGPASRLEKVVVVKHVVYQRDETPEGAEPDTTAPVATKKPAGLPF